MTGIDVGYLVQNPSIHFDFIDIKMSRVTNSLNGTQGTALTFILFGIGIQLVVLD